MNLPNHAIALPGYEVTEPLYSGSRTLVYRAVRTADQQLVVIKLLKNDHPTFSELVQFRNQYTIAKHLAIPGIVQPYSLDPYRNGYALVMEDCGGISLRHFTQHQPLRLDLFFKIALQVVDTLHLLHHQRLIHKDIKPANILIHPETQEVKLIDLSISSLLPRETQEIQNPNVLEGTLAYLSPEQTGRMNRGIDYRSDFYSLGVTFFELLSGQLPFQSNDPMEMVHAHLAKQVPSVCDLQSVVPLMLGEVIRKLMAKNAEDRYQSALGLKYDLLKCQEKCPGAELHTWFELGQRDVCDRLLIPEKLYGRETSVCTLLEAFGRVANGAAELMLVAGFSGIGKTAVVNEVHKPIVRWNGYFIKGKYDQFNRNIPFSAVVQACRDLMRQLLSESDQQLKVWKDKILAALGENGQVMIEVIPELKQIIGNQPAAPELSGNAAQNRFNLLFQKFIAVFATQSHPLVMFLDDLQWADSASLGLMQVLLSQQEARYLLLIGAYRDNEVFAAHPLMLTLGEIVKAEAIVNTLTLNPLSQVDLNDLVADTLSCSPSLALPLTELVYQKTKGNPFFATQFLKALYEEKFIAFDPQAGHWQCDMVAVRSLALTDDVVEFMALQLQKLPVATQNVLKLAACIGAQFDLETLAIISEQAAAQVAVDLWPALQEGLLLPISEVYKFYQPSILSAQTSDPEAFNSAYRFLHDRVQQAAHSLIPTSQKKATHLKIGQLLLQKTASKAIETSIFDIVNQLNGGIEIVTQQAEKNEIAQLNLVAGRKAKASTAYKAAVEYLALGINLLPENSWQTHYSLTFGLYRERAECEYLTGNLKQAENLFDFALNHAQDKFEKADIYAIKMNLKMTQGEDIQPGFEAGLRGLSILGMHLPLTVDQQQVAIKLELEKLNAKFKAVSPAALFDQPEMKDSVNKVCMSLLADLWAISYMGGHPDLAALSILLMLNTSLTYGNAESSGFAYCLYGMSLANQGDYRTAYEFGTLALKLDRHFNSTKFIYKTNNIFAHTINPYNQHLKTNLPLSRQSYQTSQEGGDVLFGIWAVSFLIWARLVKGDSLPDVYAETENYLSYVQQVNDVNMLYAFTLQRQFLLNLQDSSHHTDLLSDQPCNVENERNIPHISLWRKNKNFEHGINWYCFLKLQLLYLYGRYEEAVKTAQEAEPTLPSNAGFFPIIQYYFYYPLSLAALYPTATSEEKYQYWSILQEHQQIVKKWADDCPENFLHRYLLLSAEIAQLGGKFIEAFDLYDRAIIAATTNEYIQEAALANELAATFYLNWGKEQLAREYMTEAYYGYARWGAKSKLAGLEKRYPQLLAPILQQNHSSLSINETIFALESVTSTSSATSSSSNVSVALDLNAILKASQAISGEIELEKLLSSLLSIIIENAGANKCVLMLLRDDRLLINGCITDGTEPVVLQQIPIEESQDIPLKLIFKVQHNRQTAVLANAIADPVLASDPYIIRQQPKSILCSPILHQGKFMGILYLENNLATGAFTSDRVELLNLLCAQATISLENARLYERSLKYSQQLEQKTQALEDAVSNLQSAQIQIVQSEKMSALGNLVAGVAHEINNPVGFIAGNLQPAIDYVQDTFGLLDLYQQEYPSPSAAIQAEIEAIDLEYVREDLPKLIGSMKLGIERIQDISTSLRTFSRADKDHKVLFNIHDGIESTILILKHRLKANERHPAIEVVSDYGAIPAIECFPGQLNQVFMNILANAIDALEEANQNYSFAEIATHLNQIEIKTRLDESDQQVIIQIRDNGIGMPEEVKHRVFDHLFTTKAAGQGTGLGLAIARQIVVEKHSGSIEVYSQPEVGTQFTIILPVKSRSGQLELSDYHSRSL